MKRLLLLLVLKCYALTLPSLNNPAIWNAEENWEVKKTNTAAFRYSEPFENFHNGKLDIAWSDGRFLAAAGFGSASLDSIYRELEFSGDIGIRPFDFLSFRIGETANISWVPQNGSWQEHKILVGANFFYDWVKISLLQRTHLVSETPTSFSWLLTCEANFTHYSFGTQFPDFRLYQQISLGYFNIYNSFEYPGPVLGFGFTISLSHFFAGAGYLRGAYPSGHLGYMMGFK